jgi:hypothetical protein
VGVPPRGRPTTSFQNSNLVIEAIRNYGSILVSSTNHAVHQFSAADNAYIMSSIGLHVGSESPQASSDGFHEIPLVGFIFVAFLRQLRREKYVVDLVKQRVQTIMA